MHNAVVFNIKGPSWRLREHHALEIATTNPTRTEAPLTSPTGKTTDPNTTFDDLATEANGIPIGWVCAPANVADLKLVEDTLDAVDGFGYELEIHDAHLDRGYDAIAVRNLFAESGITAHIAHRSPLVKGRKYGTRARNPIPLGRRWRIERANSWLTNFGQLRRNTDRHPIHREAGMDLAVAFTLAVKLIKWQKRYGATTFH